MYVHVKFFDPSLVSLNGLNTVCCTFEKLLEMCRTDKCCFYANVHVNIFYTQIYTQIGNHRPPSAVGTACADICNGFKWDLISRFSVIWQQKYIWHKFRFNPFLLSKKFGYTSLNKCPISCKFYLVLGRLKTDSSMK